MSVRDAMGPLLRTAIRAYQLVISPHLAPSCRFQPTCSQYAIEAIQEHGPTRGLWLTARRLSRCHPFSPGGFDAVPRGEQLGS